MVKARVEIKKFLKSVGHIRGIFKINNVFYVVCWGRISWLNNGFYELKSKKYHDFFTSCRVGNNSLVICSDFSDEAVCSIQSANCVVV